MKVKKIKINNFRLFENFRISIPDTNFIVFIGTNGCGKSSIMDSIAMALAHVVGQLKSPNGKYSIDFFFKTQDIKNGTSKAEITLELEGFEKNIIIKTSKEIDQKNISYEIQPKAILNNLKNQLKSDTRSSLPLFAYYSLNRTTAIDYNSKIKSNYNRILNGYNNSINHKISTFQDFKTWFIYQENIENEQKIELKEWGFQIDSLKIIRTAIENFLSIIDTSEYKELKVSRYKESNLEYSETSNFAELVITKNEEEIRIEQLSSGEKMMIFLVADISRRLVILNSAKNTTLEKEGIVLIDEIELHLHPKWQRKIIPALKSVFPNVQFITTTHSPQILSSLSDKEVIIIHQGKQFTPSINPLGRDSNGILEEIFDTTDRPSEVDALIDDIFKITSHKKLDSQLVEKKLEILKNHVSTYDPIILRIENLIKRNKILGN